MGTGCRSHVAQCFHTPQPPPHAVMDFFIVHSLSKRVPERMVHFATMISTLPLRRNTLTPTSFSWRSSNKSTVAPATSVVDPQLVQGSRELWPRETDLSLHTIDLEAQASLEQEEHRRSRAHSRGAQATG